jgi:hypothetical protein
MSRIKKFQAFINESITDKNEFIKNSLIKAYDKESKPNEVIDMGEDDKFYNFYVIDSDLDKAQAAARRLEYPHVFGDFVSFEPVDITVQMNKEFKDAGLNPTESDFVIHVRVSKKFNGGISKN